MSSRRTAILIIAIVVGAVAAFGLLNYVRNVEGSVYDDAELEAVWVVRLPIAKGTTAEQAINQQMFVQAEVPASTRPATAIVDPATELAGLVAITDLPVNSPIVDGFFVAPSVVNTGITDRLEEKELVTVTFSVDQVRGAAYLIEPGDFVNVLSVGALTTIGAATDPAAAPVPADVVDIGGGFTVEGTDGSASYDNVARYVYQRAEVLAIDKALTPDLGESADETEGVAVNGGLITLAVPPDAVQTILGVGLENLYLSLVPPSYAPEPLPPLDYSDEILPGEDGQRLTPYGPGSESEPE